ncbi:hypothetical protein Tco_0558580 [Tanacetum coccineum]
MRPGVGIGLMAIGDTAMRHGHWRHGHWWQAGFIATSIYITDTCNMQCLQHAPRAFATAALSLSETTATAAGSLSRRCFHRNMLVDPFDVASCDGCAR